MPPSCFWGGSFPAHLPALPQRAAANVSQQSTRFQRILARNVVLPLLLSVGSAAVFVALIAYLVNEQRWVEHTDQVIARSYAMQRLDLDMESSLRGYLLTADDRFLEPYEQADAVMALERERLRELVSDNVAQVDRLARIAAYQARWKQFAREQIDAKRRDPGYQVGVRADDGRRMKEAVRATFDEMLAVERQLRVQRADTVKRNTIVGVASFVTLMLVIGGMLAWRGRTDLLSLSDTFGTALAEQERQSAALQAQAWLSDARAGLSDTLSREEQLAGIGRAALAFLAEWTGALVAAVYVPLDGGGFRRLATWGWAAQADGRPDLLQDGRTLVAEAAARSEPIALDSLPAGYLEVASGTVHGTAAAALVAPIRYEGRLCGVLELGFLRPLAPRDTELVATVASTLGAAIEAAQYRDRLQDALHQTQQLNEELQVQQEELRTANEELEEQSRALEESQATLENQQAELEQTNEQLAEQAQALGQQRDALRQAQGELEARADELQRASRYKSEFLANMSHELRTPLNSSLILARLLADNAGGNLDEEQVKFAQAIYSAGNDLLNLINDILDIAKVEAGKLEVRPEPTPVAAVVQTLRSLFEPLAGERGLRLDFDVAPDAPQQLFTDRQRIEQILRNLLSNGIKFTEQGSVSLHVAAEGGDQVRFDVRDSGIGIDPSQHEHIFEAFRQADGTISRRFGGTGLGLSISRDLARLLGGDLRVTSAPGEGSTFTLTVPVQYDVAARPTRATPSPAPARPPPSTAMPLPKPVAAPIGPAFPDDRAAPPDGRRTLLIIEDDRVFARILFDLAHELGFRCVVAHQA